MAFLKRLIRALPLLLLSPFLMAISFVALVLVQWAWNYFTWSRSARLITGENPHTDRDSNER